jgi:hypothetical protein
MVTRLSAQVRGGARSVLLRDSDDAAAREVTKVHGDSDTTVSGLCGSMKDVVRRRPGKFLQFGRLRQEQRQDRLPAQPGSICLRRPPYEDPLRRPLGNAGQKKMAPILWGRIMGSELHRKAALVDKRPRFPLSLTFRKPTIVRLSALWFPARTDSAVFFTFS